MDKIARLFAEVSADSSKFKRTMGGVDSHLKSTSKRFSNFTAGIVQGFGMAFGQATIGMINKTFGAMSSGISTAANVEQQIAEIQAVLQATDEDAARLNKLLGDLAVSKELKVSLGQAGAVVEMLARNGVKTQAILDGMAESTIKLANSTKGDFGQSADIITDVMALWGELGLSQKDAINSITSVITNSKLDLNNYQYAMANVAASASFLKIPFEDVNTAIALTANYFKSAREQGSSFNTFITRLVPTTKAAKAAFKELGLTGKLFDETGTLKSLDIIAKELNQAFSGLSNEEAINLAHEAFGSFGKDFALALGNFTDVDFTKTAESMSKVSASANAATITETTLSRWETFKDTIQGFGKQIGDKFLGDLKKLVNGILDLTDVSGPKFVKLFDPLAESFTRFADYLLSNSNNVLKGFENIINGIVATINFIPQLISWFMYGKKVLVDFGTEVLNVFNNMVSNIQSIFGQLLQGTTFRNFRALFDSILDLGITHQSTTTQLQHLFHTILGVISNGVKMILDQMPALWEGLKVLGKVIWDTISPGLSKIKDEIVNLVTDGSTYNAIWNALKSGWTFFADWVKYAWESLDLGMLWKYIIDWITDSQRQASAYSALKDSWTYFTDWASKIWANTSKVLIDYWNQIISWITDSSRGQQALTALESTWTWIEAWAGRLWGKVGPLLIDLWAKFQGWINEKAPNFSAWAKSVSDFIKNAYDQFKENLPLMGASVDKLSNTVTTEVPRIAQAFSDLWSAIFGGGDGSSSGGGSFANAISSLFSVITESLGGLIKYLRNTLELLTIFVEGSKAVFSGDFDKYFSLRGDFNNKISEYGNIYNEQRQGVSNALNQFWTPQDAVITLRVEDANNLPSNREAIQELARALQQEMSLSGVRVTP